MGQRESKSMILNIDADMLIEYFTKTYGFSKLDALVLIQQVLQTVIDSDAKECDAVYGLCEDSAVKEVAMR